MKNWSIWLVIVFLQMLSLPGSAAPLETSGTTPPRCNDQSLFNHAHSFDSGRIDLAHALLWVQTDAGAALDNSDVADKWKITFDYETAPLPFSFVYGGKPSRKFLKGCQRESSHKKLDDDRTEHKLTYTDPDSGLQVRLQGVEYHDPNTVEWTLYFKNTGSRDTPILSDIQALDLNLKRDSGDEFLLRHSAGGFNRPDAYQPRQTALGPKLQKRLSAAGGRPTNTDMCYFNLEAGSQGVIVAIGWPGQWAATFTRDKGTAINIRAGQELTHFKLHPSEEVRTPLIVLQFRNEGDWIDAQNTWRRWMKSYGMPKPGGKLPSPQLLAASSRAYNEMHNANEENQIMFIDRYLEEDILIDYWWMDAGWYPCKGDWGNTGTWEVDKTRFPRGFKPISDHAHSKGVKILVWFEPERVRADTWLAENHPEWIFGGAGGGLLNMGNPEALDWLTNHIDTLITENGIDLYRQDFNINPLKFWRDNDTQDRQGITEIRHVTGYLAYLDELLRRHPNMLIDTCASGGRRLDLETLRRCVPLWRSDYAFEPIGHQGQTYGLSFWLPFHGTGTVAYVDAPYYGGGASPVQPYAFWSNSGISLVFGLDMRVKELDYDTLRKLVRQWRSISADYYGDFYPLTPWSLEKNVWIGWQFHRPEIGRGMVQAFRRPENAAPRGRFKLRGLLPDARYEVTNLDLPGKTRMTGRELMEAGVEIAIEDRPGAAVVTYLKLE